VNTNLENMKLKIERETLVKDLQHEFARNYEFLKIEFFRIKHVESKLSHNAQKVEPGEKITNLLRNGKTGVIDIGRSRTVAEVEADFRNKFGIYVQVYRKSGDLWIETSKTDHWTLNGQNEEGRDSRRGSGKKSLDERLEESRWDSE
jgi:hypothetical protein